jgi:hypothetical protein
MQQAFDPLVIAQMVLAAGDCRLTPPRGVVS